MRIEGPTEARNEADYRAQCTYVIYTFTSPRPGQKIKTIAKTTNKKIPEPCIMLD